MTDEQRDWNNQREAMIEDCNERIRRCRQSIEDAQDEILRCIREKDRIGRELAEEELEELQEEMKGILEERDQLDESICF